MEHGETILYKPDEEDLDCTACHQPLGTNPYCGTCIKHMSPEKISSAKAEIAAKREQMEKRQKPKTRR